MVTLGTTEAASGGLEIYSVSDLLEIVNRPDLYLNDILEAQEISTAPLGRNHLGVARPYPHGLWFRGQSNVNYKLEPSVFRDVDKKFIDEREMFTDLRLRSSDIDLSGYNNVDLLCLMQHHGLPTRLMDWSESILIAAYFAASSQYLKSIERFYKDKDTSIDLKVDNNCEIYVLNAYRLNGMNTLSMHNDSHIFHPHELDVVIRCLMSEHTYIESVFTKISTLSHLSKDYVSRDVLKKITEISELLKNHYIDDVNWFENSMFNPSQKEFLRRLVSPIAMIPRRGHPRMDAQMSCFTAHGGKQYRVKCNDDYSKNRRKGMHYIPLPNGFDLHKANEPQGISYNKIYKKFSISKNAVSRIMIELDRIGINEALIYRDLENQSRYVKRRWTTVGSEKKIWCLPNVEPYSGNLENRKAILSNYMEKLYGET